MNMCLEGESELDGGPLSPLSEAYLSTHPNGMHLIVHWSGDLEIPALEEAIRFAQRRYPALTGSLKETRRGVSHELRRAPTERPLELQVQTHGERLEEVRRYETVTRILREEHGSPFDLLREAPLRFFLLRFPEKRQAFVINLHHTGGDGFVLKGLTASILDHYHRLTAGCEMPAFVSSPRSVADLPLRLRSNVSGVLKDLYLRRTRALVKHPPNPSHETGLRPSFARFSLNEEETVRSTAHAKRRNMTVNDWMNVAIIRAIDDVRGVPDGLMSVCVPVDLRRYLKEERRHANLTSGFHIYLRRRERLDPERLAELFARRTSRLLGDGRALFHLRAMQTTFRFLKWMPYRRRAAFWRRRGYYPTTFFCSNLGNIRLPLTTLGNGLQFLGGDVLVYPNRSADYSAVAWTYNGSLTLFLSTDERVVPPEEFERFRGRLKDYLVEG